jgi:hypothetical protein
VAVLALASAGVVTAPSAEPLDGDTAAALCKLSGIRYLGSTSRKQKLCFTLWKSGMRISEYAYAFRDNCGSWTSRTTIKTGIQIGADGGFSRGGVEGGYFKGRITGATAKGTLRAKSTNYGAIPPVTCDSGVLRWTARKAVR